MKTCNIYHDKLNVQDLVCQHMSCTNVNAKKKRAMPEKAMLMQCQSNKLVCVPTQCTS